jgi:hypothetical protein
MRFHEKLKETKNRRDRKERNHAKAISMIKSVEDGGRVFSEEDERVGLSLSVMHPLTLLKDWLWGGYRI